MQATDDELRLRAPLWYDSRVPPTLDTLRNSLAGILLDYGGTLDGDARHWFDHFRDLYRAAGCLIDESAFKNAFYAADAALEADPEIAAFGLTRMVTTHVSLQLQALGISNPALARTLVTGFIGDTTAAWNRNRPLLRRLATRYRLGIVSNSYGNMPALLEDGSLGPFAVVLDSAIEGIRKPDPALYVRAAERLDLPPAGILHVGDSWPRDVVPAHAVGMHAAWLSAPDTPMPASPRPVCRLSSLLELENLLA